MMKTPELLFTYTHEDGRVSTYRTIPSTDADSEIIPLSIGAGDSRGMSLVVYQDVDTGKVFHRTPENFRERMQKAQPAQPTLIHIPAGSTGRMTFHGLCRKVAVDITAEEYVSLHHVLVTFPRPPYSHLTANPTKLPPFVVDGAQYGAFEQQITRQLVNKSRATCRIEVMVELFTPDNRTIGMWHLAGVEIDSLDHVTLYETADTGTKAFQALMDVRFMSCGLIVDHTKEYR